VKNWAKLLSTIADSLPHSHRMVWGLGFLGFRVYRFIVRIARSFAVSVAVAMDTLIVFDFDWSLIDCNSDTWVVDKLGAMERMTSFQGTLPWTQLMVLRSIGFHFHLLLLPPLLLL
jgi:hypothetical protein